MYLVELLKLRSKKCILLIWIQNGVYILLIFFEIFPHNIPLEQKFIQNDCENAQWNNNRHQNLYQ